MKIYIGFGLLEMTTYGSIAYAVYNPNLVTAALATATAAATWLIWRALGGRFGNLRYVRALGRTGAQHED